MKGFHYLGICIILVFVALDLGCTSKEKPVECIQTSDCSGRMHIMCVGSWSCIENKCVWNCDNVETVVSSTTTSSTSTTFSGKRYAQEGEFCGGIAGIMCDSGLQCKLDGNYPDAGGVCVEPIKTPDDILMKSSFPKGATVELRINSNSKVLYYFGGMPSLSISFLEDDVWKPVAYTLAYNSCVTECINGRAIDRCITNLQRFCMEVPKNYSWNQKHFVPANQTCGNHTYKEFGNPVDAMPGIYKISVKYYTNSNCTGDALELSKEFSIIERNN